jgi:PAS domain S-box-containing protein
MGLSMGMGLNTDMMGRSGGMPVSNINYLSGQQSYGAPVQPIDKEALEKQMTAERRLRNREHAKRSRVRKKFMLESLQEQVRKLQEENSDLRLLVQKHIPENALKIIDDCCTSSTLFGVSENDAGEKSADTNSKSDKTALIKTDFSLIESLTSGQQNFVLSDPRLPDNPIVFATPGFYELTGYTREQVLGRNCRFLQGPGTDPKAVDVIRSAIANGNDATVCLLNYKADGTPFWNQFFVAALRDADNCIVNYVGVQTLVEPNAGASALEEKVNAAHPIKLGQDGEKEEED